MPEPPTRVPHSHQLYQNLTDWAEQAFNYHLILLEIVLLMCYPKNFVQSTILENIIKRVLCSLHLCPPPQIPCFGDASWGWGLSAGGSPFLLCNWAKDQSKRSCWDPWDDHPHSMFSCHIALGTCWGQSLIVSCDLPWVWELIMNANSSQLISFKAESFTHK